ncbi:MAG: L-2-hydroxyglutarate oxidase [Candidatus Scalindua sp.]|jgi:(S)-2-hydroxyglutarate dehydrogenase|nr:L-2-hydroxyglutarate oxidase [Deltaproteobacteria bacterium]MBT6225667.1 L-2-hydroxyglutarate oxidase [Candidatus Scalindua sp.]
MIQNSDYIIIGAGIIGLTIALELKHRDPNSIITILEKESEPGKHSSVRNSGVLHSGIYYPPDSLRAKICSQGAKEMATFHEKYNLPIIRPGKILIATNDYDAPQLDLLYKRAKENGIEAEELDEQSLKELEPETKSLTGKALWIPSTAVGNPEAVMKTMIQQIKNFGIKLYCNVKITKVSTRKKQLTLANGYTISYGHVVNSAGLHADKIAHSFGVGKQYTLLPFKGVYWKLKPEAGFKIQHLIYPVPDLRVPFLGVHTTTTTDGTIYIGPTAVPAFGRENYSGLTGITTKELMRISSLLTKQFIKGQNGFRRLAWQEGRRYFKPWFVEAAQALLPRLKPEHLITTGKVGIRAQILDRNTGNMVNDFLVEQGLYSTHILNSISPAWTSAFPFARYVCDNFIGRN